MKVKHSNNKYAPRNATYLLNKNKSVLSKFDNPKTASNFKLVTKLIAELLVTVFIVFTIVFILVNLIPGDNQIITSAKEKGDAATIIAIEELFDLDKSGIERYFISLGNILNGSFGLSGTTGTDVGPMLFERMSLSIQIGAIAISFSILIGIPIGIFLARRQTSWSEALGGILSSLAFSVPTFVIGFLFMLVNYHLGLPIIFDYGNPFMYLIPALVISIPIAFTYTRYLRVSIRKEYQEQYVAFARVKGVSEEDIFWKHIFKSSLYPIATYFPITVIAAFFGSITIETVFGIPGSGEMLVSSVLSNDHNAILGLSVVYTILIVFGFFIREIIYILIDPRAKEV